jgi:hypothetical protein
MKKIDWNMTEEKRETRGWFAALFSNLFSFLFVVSRDSAIST